MNEAPKHIAIIMDGNGRWAAKRKLPRVMGHRRGVETVDTITEACARLGIEALTLYTFSSENWKRPKEEVETLMGFLEMGLRDKEKKIMANNIRFNVIGRIDSLSPALQDALKGLMERTASNSGMVLTLALSYGGRQEILDAVKDACRKCSDGEDVLSWEEKDFAELLYTQGLPDPDLVIRTSGEMRVSNFLLWQSAYSEFYVTDTLWPDFNAAELKKAIDEYSARDRRYGG